MFTILRNLHYNEVRKNRVHIQSLDDPLAYESAVLPSQVASLVFGDFRRAFWQLADDLLADKRRDMPALPALVQFPVRWRMDLPAKR